jgi:hypothetical protein
MRFSAVVENWRFVDFGRSVACLAGSNVTNRNVFNTHFLFNMHRSKFTLVFLVFDYGVMSVSTTSGRPRREVTSSVDMSDHGFLFVF